MARATGPFSSLEIPLPGPKGALGRLTLVPAAEDNYVYTLRSAEGGVVVVDPTTARAVELHAERERIKRIDAILCTHHHHDHVGGNLELMRLFDCRVVCGKPTRERVPGVSAVIKVGARSEVAPGIVLECIAVPGHTRDHCAFYSADFGVLFSGDTIFSLGVGRVFDGSTPQDLYRSVRALADRVPDETLVACAHEYTYDNAKFAVADAEARGDGELASEIARHVRAHVRNGDLHATCTVPTTMGFERRMNPFLLAGSEEEFVAMRARKDTFSGEVPSALR